VGLDDIDRAILQRILVDIAAAAGGRGVDD